MLDLEDAVAASEKAAARATVCECALAAATGGPLVGVRINSLASGLADADLAALAEALPRIALITVPMVEGPDEVRHVAGRLDELERAAGPCPAAVALLAMTETARGVLAARAIAESSPRLRTLMLRAGRPRPRARRRADRRRHRVPPRPLGRSCSRRAPPASRHRSTAPISSSTTTRAAPSRRAWARRLGFQGKVVLHPRQLPIAAAAFAPGERELAWAREVDRAFSEAEAAGVSSIKLADGTFVDYPVAERARDILRASDR